MSITYTTSTVSNTFVANYRAVGPDGAGQFQFNQRRAFLSFDLTGSGLSLSLVTGADLILVCESLVGGGCPVRVTSAVDPNGWGLILDATNADWASTDDNVEGIVSVTATGLYTIPVNIMNINFSGVTYYRLMNDEEGASAAYNQGARFFSRNAGTPSNRPILRIHSSIAGTEKVMAPVVGGTEKTIALTVGTKKVLT